MGMAEISRTAPAKPDGVPGSTKGREFVNRIGLATASAWNGVTAGAPVAVGPTAETVPLGTD